MKLGAMADAFQKQLDTDEAAALSFEERLRLLVDTEWTARGQRKLQRRLQTAQAALPGVARSRRAFHFAGIRVPDPRNRCSHFTEIPSAESLDLPPQAPDRQTGLQVRRVDVGVVAGLVRPDAGSCPSPDRTGRRGHACGRRRARGARPVWQSPVGRATAWRSRRVNRRAARTSAIGASLVQ